MKFNNKAEFAKAIIEAGTNGLTVLKGVAKVSYDESHINPFIITLEGGRVEPMGNVWDSYDRDWIQISKPMSTKKFLRKKNKLVKRVTGVTLIPKDQIVETPRVQLDDNDYDSLNADICPYCHIYRTHINAFQHTCDECPMAKAGNKCESKLPSSWKEANNLWIDKATKSDQQELQELVVQYNKG